MSYKNELLSQIEKYSKQYPQIAPQLARVKREVEATDDKVALQAIATQAWSELKKLV